MRLLIPFPGQDMETPTRLPARAKLMPSGPATITSGPVTVKDTPAKRLGLAGAPLDYTDIIYFT